MDKTIHQPETAAKVLMNTMVVILSGMYGILLIVLGFVIPVTEALSSVKSLTPRKFEIFYMYLYSVSLAFLFYVYMFLFRKEGVLVSSLTKKLAKSVSRIRFRADSERSATAAEEDDQDHVTGEDSSRWRHATTGGRPRKKRITFASQASSNHTGSFYLRVGAVGFGLGSMIHSSILFCVFMEIYVNGHPQGDVLRCVKPLVHVIFTFAQMYFVFMNSKMCIHKYQTLARFGLMHMSATNVCVWLRSVVVETMHVMQINHSQPRSQQRDSHNSSGGGGFLNAPYAGNTLSGGGDDPLLHWANGTQPIGDRVQHVVAAVEDESGFPELQIHPTAMMGKLLESSSSYLFPCTIQYSLICAGVLCVMWSNVCQGSATLTHNRSQRSPNESSIVDGQDDGVADERLKSNRIRVDCAGSSQGLFLGLALFVGALCCLIWYYILIGEREAEFLVASSLLGHICEDFIYIATIVALAIASFQMKDMRFFVGMHAGIEGILTLVSLSGLGLFGMFSIVASIYYLHTLDGVLTILTNVVMLVQAGAQATFMLATLRVSAVDDDQARRKPGRNCITFLLVSNFTLWVMNTFETQRIEHNVVQIDFYGSNAWAIFTHISVPLGIYYRFHSTVCLSNIWKNAWKTKATKT